jgi:hypothetical protein
VSTEKHRSPPLPVGITLDRGFSLLRTHPRPLLVPQLVLNIATLLIALVVGGVGYLLLGHVDSHLEYVRVSQAFGDSKVELQKVPDFTDGQIVTLVVAGVIILVVYLWFLLAATATVVRGADRAIEGREHVLLRPALRDGLRAAPKLFGLGLVFGIAALIVFFGVGLIIALLFLATPALGVLGVIAGLALTAWLGVRLVLWPIVHLSEGTGFASFSRAFELSKGQFWRLFGVLMLVGIVVAVVGGIASFVLALIFSAISSIGDAVGIVAFIPYVIGSTVLGVVITACFIAPIVVAYRTLAGRDNADLWQAAAAMGGGSAAPADPSVRRWDASEAPIDQPAQQWSPPTASSWDGPSRTGDAPAPTDPPGQDAPPPGGRSLGGLPPSDEASDAERRWGRRDEPPAS